MSKVKIYNTHEEMWQQLGQSIYDANLKTRETLDDLYEKAMLEYKEKSGFNERWNKGNEELRKKNSRASVFPPHMVHLPDAERKKFGEQYHDLGKGLELTVLVCLSATGSRYNFGSDSAGSLPFMIEGEEPEYDNLASLVQDVKKVLPKMKYWSTRFTPTFYTIKEELAIVPEDISNDPEAYLREMAADAEKSETPAEFKDLLLEGLKEFAYCKDKIRGLTDQECAEFERLYFNTP